MEAADDTRAADEAAVLAVVHEFDEALERGDVETVSTLCLEDFVFFGSGRGEESRGPAGLVDMLTALRAEAGADLISWDLSLEPYEVAVRGDTARVTACGHYELVTRSVTRSGRYLLLGVLCRTPDGWRWWAFHGSEPQPW
jgi:ketosteroid isomerase-like protein